MKNLFFDKRGYMYSYFTFDKDKTHREIDSNGYMIIRDNPIAKSGVFEYLGAEIGGSEPDKIYKVYRPFEELLKSKDDFAGKPILLNHKWVDPAEKNDMRGSVTGEVRAEEPYLYATLTIIDKETQEAIESGKYAELSPGYLSDYEETSGEYEGEHYDYIQRNIRFNHLALVEVGRSGHDLRALDESINSQKEIETMEKNEETKDLETQAPETIGEGAETTKDDGAIDEEVLAFALKSESEFDGGIEEKEAVMRELLAKREAVKTKTEEAQPEAVAEEQAPEASAEEEVKDEGGDKNEQLVQLVSKIAEMLGILPAQQDEAPVEVKGTETADGKSFIADIAKSHRAKDEVLPYTGEFNIFTQDNRILTPKEIYSYAYKCLGGNAKGVKDPESAFKAYVSALQAKKAEKTFDTRKVGKDLDSMLSHIK